MTKMLSISNGGEKALLAVLVPPVIAMMEPIQSKSAMSLCHFGRHWSEPWWDFAQHGR